MWNEEDKKCVGVRGASHRVWVGDSLNKEKDEEEVIFKRKLEKEKTN